MTLRMVIVVPADLKMSPGKLASQVAHAALRCGVKAPRRVLTEYLHEETKLVLAAKNAAMMRRIAKRAEKSGLTHHVFRDSPPTTEGTENKVTAMCIGPATADELQPITGDLPLYGMHKRHWKKPKF